MRAWVATGRFAAALLFVGPWGGLLIFLKERLTGSWRREGDGGVAEVSRALEIHTQSAGKCVLFVDSGSLATDKNAGDVSLSQFMASFARHGWAVVFWSCASNPVGLSPVDPMFPSIRRLSTASTGLRFEAWWVRHAQHFDAVLLSRPFVAAALLSVIRRHGRARLAYYGHDLHFSRLSDEAALNGRWGLPWIAGRYLRLERSVWRGVDLSYYPSEREVQMVKSLEPSVKVSYLAPYHFELMAPVPSAAPAGRVLLFVGNFTHPPNVDAIEWLLREIWPLVRSALPDAELMVVGSGLSDELKCLCSTCDRVQALGWVSDDELVRCYERARVAVVPLRFGAGVKHKVVAAMAHGCPVVATPVGMQGLDDVSAAVAVADAPQQVVQACVRLCTDDAWWLQSALSGRRAIAERFTSEAMWTAFAALREVS